MDLAYKVKVEKSKDPAEYFASLGITDLNGNNYFDRGR